MAKFCSTCGKPLIEGQACEYCEKGKQDNQQENQIQEESAASENQSQSDQYKEQAKKVADKAGNELKNLFEKAKKILKDPAKEIPEIVKAKDNKTSLMLIGGKALIVALLALLVILRVEKATGFELGKAQIFFIILIMAFVQDMILVVSLLLSDRFIFKGESNFETMMAAVSTKSIFDIVIYIVAFIVSLLSGGLGFAMISLGTTVSFLFVYKAYASISKTSETSKLYGFIIGVLIYAIFVAFIFWIFKDTMATSIENMISNAITRKLGNMFDGFGW